ncbi:MAG: hypothetical protein COB85_02740 [Bacteroidetes bacterium]|nr:MAG: hypothetical protein COB85_02740 [Bacteroidota bacterium]
MSTALVFTIVLTSMMNKIILLWLIPAGLISALYTIPFVRVNGSWWRLRDIGYFKTLLIALTVTFVTVYLPIIDAGNEIIVISMETALICAERFFFIMCITIPFDIRDLKLDEKMGLKTIPSLLGVKKSLALSIVFLAFFVVTFLYHFASTDFMSLAVFMALLASAIVTAFIVIYSTPNRTEYFFSFLVEGTMVIQFLFLLLAY